MLLNMPGSRFRRSASTRITQAPARVVAVVALLSLAAGLAPFSSSPASAEQVTLSGAIESQGGVGVVDPTSDEVVATTRAVRNGVYGLSVEAGVYTVRVIPPSGSFGSPIQLLGRSITTTTTLDVVLPREGDLALTGRVTDGDDNGAPGVSVTLDAVDGGAPLETATDGTGAYRVELPAGSYSLSLRCDVCSPASAIPDHLDLTTDSPLDLSVSTVVDLPIPAAAVTVQVDDAAGNPVAGADVTASGMTVDRASIGGVAYAGQTSDTAPVTGADGMTAFRLLRTDLGPTPGNYRFVASPPMGSGLAPSELDGVEVTGDGEVLLTLAADATATPLPTATPSPSPTDTPTDTPTATPTSTAEAETTATVTPGITSTTTATAEATAMPTETPTPSPTETANPTPTFSLLPTSTPSSTPTTEPPPTDTPTAVPTPTSTQPSTATSTPTDSPDPTETPTSSPTVTPVPTSAPTSTPSPTASPTASPTPEPAPGLDVALSAPSGQPLPAACFHLYRAEEDGRRGEVATAACDADGDGLTSFDGLLVGRFLVAIAHPAAGHRFVDDVPVELAGSGRVTLRIISPPGGASIVVTSVTAAGLRYGESCFGLFATGPTGGDAPRHLESVCDGADWTTVFGDVEFDGLPPGHYRLLRFTEAEGYLTTETQHDFEMTPDERDVRLGHELGAPSTATSTVTPDPTTTSTPTDTPSVTPTVSATAMPTGTPTATPTDTAVPTSTATHTGTPTPPSTSTGTPTSTPDATGTPTVRSTATRAATPTGTPPPITPNVALSKTKSKYNGAVVASLSGFTPNSVVTLRWPDGSRLAATTVDAAGSGSVAFPTPLAPLGTYRVEARDGAGKSARASLSVIPRIMLNIDEGWSSTRIRVYLYGYAAGERVEVRWYTTNGSSYVVVKTVAIASTGRGSSLVDIPARTGVGTHKVMGRVVGVARSASTTFRVTRAASGSERPAPIGTATAAATPTPTVTATATPTPTVPPASPTAAPMPSPEPSSTPTATPTQEPIATATPTATITPAPESTIEPTPEPTTVPETTSDATPAPTPEQA